MNELDPYKEDLARNKKESTVKKSLELGYQSDSEDESADSDNSATQQHHSWRKKDESNNSNDGNDDMFASDPESDKPQEKDPRLLDMEQFVQEQGLEGTTESEAKVYGASEVEQLQKYYASIEDPSSRGVIKSLPEVQLEAFNLQDEAEHGTFDKDMNYTREANSDDETTEDAWMGGVKSADIAKAKKAQETRQQAAAKPRHVRALTDLLQSIIEILEPAETALEALARLRPPKKRKRGSSNEADDTRKKTVFELTECCEQLISLKGVRDAYDMSREELMRLYKREAGQEFSSKSHKRKADTLDSPETSPGYGEAIWEFRWLGETDINGPFSSYEMKYWVDNYFENKVEVRRQGSGHFVPVQKVQFDA